MDNRGALTTQPARSKRPARAHYHHGDLPAALKRAAVALIARDGVESFSLREAAAAVGVSPSAAYRHYADKASLLSEIADDAFAELADRFETAMRAVAGQDAAAARMRFLAQGHAYVRFALEQPERFTVMFGRYGAGRPGTPAEAGSNRRDPFSLLSQVLDDLQSTGAVPPARRNGAELIAWSAIHGLASLLVAGAIRVGAGGVDAMIDRVGEDCLSALAAASPRRTRRATGR